MSERMEIGFIGNTLQLIVHVWYGTNVQRQATPANQKNSIRLRRILGGGGSDPTPPKVRHLGGNNSRPCGATALRADKKSREKAEKNRGPESRETRDQKPGGRTTRKPMREFR
jgi:hypothetical protein